MQLLMPYCGNALASLTAEQHWLKRPPKADPLSEGDSKDALVDSNHKQGVAVGREHMKRSPTGAGVKGQPRRRQSRFAIEAGHTDTISSGIQQRVGGGPSSAPPSMSHRKAGKRGGRGCGGVLTVAALLLLAAQLPAALYFCGYHQRC